MKPISVHILEAVDEALQAARNNHHFTLNVYVVAECIRMQNLSDNVALESIVEVIVMRASSEFCFEFDQTAVAHSLLGCPAIEVEEPPKPVAVRTSGGLVSAM